MCLILNYRTATYYDRCEVTWSGWSIIACAADTPWKSLPPDAPERALRVGDMRWVMDVSAARNDMEHTQLLLSFDLDSVAAKCSSTILRRATAVSLAVYGESSSDDSE